MREEARMVVRQMFYSSSYLNVFNISVLALPGDDWLKTCVGLYVLTYMSMGASVGACVCF